MRALLIADSAQEKVLKPVLKEAGLIAEVVDTLQQGNFKLETRTFEIVLVDKKRANLVPMLVAWRFRGFMGNVIVLLPSSSRPYDRTRCLDAGADVCMTHPIDIDELCALLRAFSRRNHSGSVPVMRVHDLEINTVDRTVLRAGQPINLTPREFDLLYLLATKQGKVLTQAIIRNHLFEGENTAGSNIVSVFIRFLRKKIDEGFDPPLILTRWGQGYLLRPEDDPDE